LVLSGKKGDRDEGDKDEKEGETLSVTDSEELNIKAQHVNCSSDCINGSNLISVYFNAQSVMNKLDDLHTMVCSFQPDIIGIYEGWTNSNILDSELEIPGYETFRCDRPNLHRGGGVVLYVRSELQPTQHFPKSPFPEQVWCKLRKKNREELLIGVVTELPLLPFTTITLIFH